MTTIFLDYKFVSPSWDYCEGLIKEAQAFDAIAADHMDLASASFGSADRIDSTIWQWGFGISESHEKAFRYNLASALYQSAVRFRDLANEQLSRYQLECGSSGSPPLVEI